ncbi:hypothetical protein ONZ45_g13243 [Pleurotus djamor]|nr:hypothetical protein ONZ45_g13243 [Pleurotus djamor]
MISLNHTFYNLVLDSAYREVEWKALNMETVYSIDTLSNPSLAARVRKVEISLPFIRSLYTDTPYTRPKRSGIQDIPFKGLPLWYHIQHIKSRRSKSHRSRTWIEIREKTQRTEHGKTADLRAEIESAITYMVNITDCVLYLRSSASEIRPFMDRLFNTLNASNLRKLVLECDSTTLLATIIESVQLKHLEELDLELEFSPGGDAVMAYVVDKLPPWINSMSPNLTSLYFLFPWTNDSVSLFDGLGDFPRLTRIALRPLWISGSSKQLDDPTPFLNFISRQNTPQLNDVSLLPHIQRLLWAPLLAQLDENSQLLTRLKKLTLSHLPDDFQLILALIRRTVNTLECLALEECRLGFKQITALAMTVGGAPSNRLHSLTVDVEILCTAVLDVFNKHLPFLQSLSIVFKDVGGTYLDAYGFEAEPSEPETISASESIWYYPTFTRSLTVHRYLDWALLNFGAWHYAIEDCNPGVSERQIMFAVAEAAPNLRTLRGKPLRDMEFHGMTPNYY